MKTTKINIEFDVPIDKLEAFGKIVKATCDMLADKPVLSEPKPPQNQQEKSVKPVRKKRKARKKKARRYNSPKRKETEKWVTNYFKQHGYYPSYEEVGKYFNLNYKATYARLARYRVRMKKNQKPEEGAK